VHDGPLFGANTSQGIVAQREPGPRPSAKKKLGGSLESREKTRGKKKPGSLVARARSQGIDQNEKKKTERGEEKRVGKKAKKEGRKTAKKAWGNGKDLPPGR